MRSFITYCLSNLSGFNVSQKKTSVVVTVLTSMPLLINQINAPDFSTGFIVLIVTFFWSPDHILHPAHHAHTKLQTTPPCFVEAYCLTSFAHCSSK